MYDNPERLKYEVQNKRWIDIKKRIKKNNQRDIWKMKAIEAYDAALEIDPDSKTRSYQIKSSPVKKKQRTTLPSV